MYSTVAPASGDRLTLILPTLNTTTLQVFIAAFAATNPLTFNVLLLDTSAVHITSPALNPVECLWQDVRGRMAWRLFDDRDTLKIHDVGNWITMLRFWHGGRI